jgi:hypothetical protein
MKVWKYISAFLAGALSVSLLAWRSVGDNYKIGINKLKQKGKGNILESELDANIVPQTKRGGRLERKFKREQDKIIKRNAKKEKKALRQLDKFNLN